MQIVNFKGETGIPRGDTFTVSLNFEIPINGWILWWTVKKLEDINDSDDTNAVIQKKITIPAAPPDILTYTITLTSTDTDIEPKVYKYDVQVKQPDGSITTVFRGDFEILPSVTRSTE
jgi:hypothetical protein